MSSDTDSVGSDSPFVSKKRKTVTPSQDEDPSKGTIPKNCAYYIHVKPDIPSGNRGLEGYVFYSTGYGEKVSTEPLYKRKEEKNQKYISDLAMVPHVFEILDTETGAIKKSTYGSKPQKALIWILEDDMPALKEEDFKGKHIHGRIIKYIKKLEQMWESSLPKYVDGVSYKLVNSWSQVLPPTELNTLLAMERDPDTHKTPEAFLRSSKDIVYSMWPVGEVPNKCIRRYALTAKHLEEADIANAGNTGNTKA